MNAGPRHPLASFLYRIPKVVYLLAYNYSLAALAASSPQPSCHMNQDPLRNLPFHPSVLHLCDRLAWRKRSADWLPRAPPALATMERWSGRALSHPLET